ncbi:MAG: hypothetical protein WC501_02410 [Candidatus Micrarchaeia archaeon]
MNSQTLRLRPLKYKPIPSNLVDALTQLSKEYGGLQNIPSAEFKKLQQQFKFTITPVSPDEISGLYHPQRKPGNRFLHISPMK